MQSWGLCIAGMLLILSAAAHADRDHDTSKRLRDAGEIVSLETILKAYRQRYGGGRILETELEFERGRYVYEIKFLGKDGTVRELEYDARTGKLLAYEVIVPDEDGTLQELEYDPHTGELLRSEEEH